LYFLNKVLFRFGALDLAKWRVATGELGKVVLKFGYKWKQIGRRGIEEPFFFSIGFGCLRLARVNPQEEGSRGN
jgi:hypothetical protein